MTASTRPLIVSTSIVPLRQDAKIMSVVGLAHASSHFGHLLLAPLFPFFINEFGLSYSQLGFLVTLFFVISGVGQATSGFLVDKVGARPVLYGALSLFLLASLTAASAGSYNGLMLAAALAGLGNASFHPVDFTILNQRVSAPRLGYAFSVHGITGNLGWALAPVFLVGIASLYDWRTACYCAALLYVCVLTVTIVYRDVLVTQQAKHPADSAARGVAFLKLPVVWWCFGYFLLSTMTLAVVQSFALPILQALHGVSLKAATLTLSAYMVAGALGMVAGGWVAARHPSSDRVVALCMAVAAALFAVCATGWLGAIGSCIGLAITGFAIGIGGPSRDLMIKKATPSGATGRVYGTVYSGLDVGFALSPVVFGWFMDRGMYTSTLFGAAFVLLLSVVAAMGVGRETRARPKRTSA
jgi:MFS transporter, FSR family, fosmidomycin resistance protein